VLKPAWIITGVYYLILNFTFSPKSISKTAPPGSDVVELLIIENYLIYALFVSHPGQADTSIDGYKIQTKKYKIDRLPLTFNPCSLCLYPFSFEILEDPAFAGQVLIPICRL